MGSNRGPRLNQPACIGEEVKIGIHLAIERFRLDENRKDLEFPSSFTATERAYIHRMAQSLGLKSKSKGKGANRFLTLYKKEGSGLGGWVAGFQLARNSRHQVMSLLQRLPLTTRERADLQPRTHKMSVSEVTREFNKTTTGRLNNGVPQVPPRRGESDLNSFRQTLPVYHMREEILATINNNQVSLVSGETGSGKTTQVPQMILDDCYSKNQQCRILCTQPRRIAALSVAERVAAERAERIGQTVGYQIRLESKVSPKTLLTFCTNGVLLRTLMGGIAPLSTVTHVIVDEVHERDRFSDFLLTCLKEALPRFKHLKVILMSAALNVQLFASYFGNCPVVMVPGTLFNVDEYFLEDVLKWTGYSNKVMEKLKREKQNASRQQEKLSEWCTRQLTITDTGDSHSPDPSADDGVADLDSTEIGEEKEELDPGVKARMDELLTAVWLSGQDDAFHQIFHLIMSENVSIDYIHSATSVTPLMVAAGRGYLDVVEQLLNLGANVNLRASNGWTAVEWAKHFKQAEVVELLEAHISTLDAGLVENGEAEDLQLMSPEDRELLSLYQQSFDDDKVDITLVTHLLLKIHTTQPEGAILVFLPGYDDIVSMGKAINECPQFDRCKVFVLHSAMQSSDQKKVFNNFPHNRKIILSTNIAETSITINDVVHVVDTGKVKEKTYDALTSSSSLKCNWISKASALQRKGRAGRCRAGVCYHLFSRARHAVMMDYQQPEILRLQLHELCLHTKLLAPTTMTIAEFLGRCPQAPPFLIIRNAVTMLKQMDALDEWEELTELGHHLTDLPVEPRLGKMVLHAVVLKCLDPILTIVCALAHKDPFMLPALPSQKRASNMARRKFAAGTFSDHMALLRAFQMWQKARTEGWEKSFCEKNFLSAASMEMVVGMRAQLLGQLRASGFVRARGGGDIRDLNTNSENWAVVKAALCAGIFPNVLYVNRKKNTLVTQKESKVQFHQRSVLSVAPTAASLDKKSHSKAIQALPCDWLVYEEMTRMERLGLVRCCTLVSPITIVIFAGPSKLPADALKVADSAHDGEERPDGLAEDSDSEGEDKSEGKKTQLQLDEWLTFSVDAEAAHLAFQLRQKWHALFLRRMRAPSKPWSQSDEEVVRAVINVLTNEEQATGLQQPAGIGQRPRPMSAETIMSGAGGGHGYTDNYNEDYSDRSNSRYTPSRRVPASPPKRPFQTFRNSRTADDNANVAHSSNTGSVRSTGSAASTPCPSPSPQSASPARSTGGGSGGSSSGSVDANSDPGANSSAPCRYFVMKCNNQRNLEISQGKGIWATSAANERKMNRAFQDGKTVYLIFSVQGSGHFQGYAKMTSDIGREKSADFSAPGLSGTFSIEWVKRANVPFMATHHLHNQWNENRKVQVSRDGQELEPSIGEALLKLWDRYPNYQKRSSPSSGSKTILKHTQQGRQSSTQQQHKDEVTSPGIGHTKPGASPASSSQDHQDVTSDPDSGMGHGHGDGPHSYQHRMFAQQHQQHSAPGSYQNPAVSSAPNIPPGGSIGMFPHNIHHQMAPGFNQMYPMGPMGAAGGMVIPSQPAMSPRPGISPVMILQRGTSSPGQVHPHPGFITQGFGGQGPGMYQPQGNQGQNDIAVDGTDLDRLNMRLHPPTEEEGHGENIHIPESVSPNGEQTSGTGESLSHGEGLGGGELQPATGDTPGETERDNSHQRRDSSPEGSEPEGSNPEAGSRSGSEPEESGHETMVKRNEGGAGAGVNTAPGQSQFENNAPVIVEPTDNSVEGGGETGEEGGEGSPPQGEPSVSPEGEVGETVGSRAGQGPQGAMAAGVASTTLIPAAGPALNRPDGNLPPHVHIGLPPARTGPPSRESPETNGEDNEISNRNTTQRLAAVTSPAADESDATNSFSAQPVPTEETGNGGGGGGASGTGQAAEVPLSPSGKVQGSVPDAGGHQGLPLVPYDNVIPSPSHSAPTSISLSSTDVVSTADAANVDFSAETSSVDISSSTTTTVFVNPLTTSPVQHLVFPLHTSAATTTSGQSRVTDQEDSTTVPLEHPLYPFLDGESTVQTGNTNLTEITVLPQVGITTPTQSSVGGTTVEGTLPKPENKTLASSHASLTTNTQSTLVRSLSSTSSHTTFYSTAMDIGQQSSSLGTTPEGEPTVPSLTPSVAGVRGSTVNSPATSETSVTLSAESLNTIKPNTTKIPGQVLAVTSTHGFPLPESPATTSSDSTQFRTVGNQTSTTATEGHPQVVKTTQTIPPEVLVHTTPPEDRPTEFDLLTEFPGSGSGAGLEMSSTTEDQPHTPFTVIPATTGDASRVHSTSAARETPSTPNTEMRNASGVTAIITKVYPEAVASTTVSSSSPTTPGPSEHVDNTLPSSGNEHHEQNIPQTSTSDTTPAKTNASRENLGDGQRHTHVNSDDNRTNGRSNNSRSDGGPSLNTDSPMYVEIKLQMTWSEFCSNEPTFCFELTDILRQQQDTFTVDQIRLMDDYQKICAEQEMGAMLDDEEIEVQLYLVNKTNHYDGILTLVCAQVIKQGFEQRESSLFKNKFLDVRLQELEREGIPPSFRTPRPVIQEGLDPVDEDDDFISQPGVTIAVVIASVGGVCCVTLIIMQIVLRRRYREGMRTLPSRSYSATSVDSIALAAVAKSRPSSGVFNPALDLSPEQREISHQMNFTELANFSLDLGAMYTEFQMIPNKMPRLSVVPTGAEDKNRYANVLPIPETRVRLDKRPGDDTANFINANYVSGYHGDQKTYIATQAPLESTVGDFWRMVWEQQSRAIVMLINLQDNGHPKCATYFPDSVGPESSVQCGEYDVTMTKRDVHQEYITSWLQIKTKGGETREVRHFWLTCWPLQGRPEAISLVRFVLDSRPQYEDSGAPLIVHCSNGTGRTGTFIALDICMRQFENRRTVDVMRCVHAMRQERAGCVQTSEQYALVYNALQEYATILSSPAISAASSAATLHAILP
ncbi:hypothetical protein BaRGS_00016958 [Batillaria attramentaria]|uniref:RNA helicase n=1 Tax=Batillaria attramentaria TaxID=370345 RepID=A0ABD0KWV2_9CAEN